jgi:hypothetical protein
MTTTLSPEQQEVLTNFRSETPVRVGALANALGLGIVQSTLHPGISGQIEPSNDYLAGFLIRVNRHEVKERQRFTIAHEIGHYALHRDRIGHGITDTILYRSKLSSSLEVEANKFAAQLLMPLEKVREFLQEFGGRKDRQVAGEIARKFGVSTDAMEIRLGLR